MTDATVDRLNTALRGRYRIERRIGEGGMATVYLAEDVRHERKVAVKVLRPELAAVMGAERFVTEIRTTANLQHPHILALFDSGEADGFLFYVMPYIEGESLGEKLEREGQLSVEDSVQITRDVANALDYAHRQGVIHRDIKPGNILIHEGQPVVADFGIALAVSAAGGGRLTETGLSLGTPHYMSPEQATADRPPSAASDVYSLGCVLFEMLTGEPPFTGPNAQAVLGKILLGEVAHPTQLRHAIPPNVESVVLKALEKLPADRFGSAAEMVRALNDPRFRHGEEAAMAAGTGPWKRIAYGTGALSAAALSAVALLALAMVRGSGGSAPVMRQEIVPWSQGVARPVGSTTALAPDGSSLVYGHVIGESQDSWQLFLKRRSEIDATPLRGTEGGQNVTYSPDGQHIVFASGTEIKRRPIGDGSTVTLARDARAGQVGLAWLDDGTILYEAEGVEIDSVSGAQQVRSLVVLIPASGGAADALGGLPADVANVFYIGALPGSRGALIGMCVAAGCPGGSQLHVADLANDTTRLLIDDVVRGWYAPTGQLIYVRLDGAVFAAPFDLDLLEVTGAGMPLFEDVPIQNTTPEMVVGPDGTMLYATGASLTLFQTELVWVDRQGSVTSVDQALAADYYLDAALSPDEQYVAVTINEGPYVGPGGTAQLWVKQLPSGPLTRLTNDPGFTRRPVWSLDGGSVTYISRRVDIPQPWDGYSVSADGSSQARLILDRDRSVFEIAFTPDGAGLVIREGDASVGAADIKYLDLATDSVNEDLLSTQFNERAVSVSPDGNWITYVSNLSGGQDQVFVRPFPSVSSQYQVSVNGGTNPVWAHNGTELFYIDGDGWLTAASFQTDSGFHVSERARLFDAASYYQQSPDWRRFDVSRDDQRFLMVRLVGTTEEAAPRYILVQNFFEELKERAGR